LDHGKQVLAEQCAVKAIEPHLLKNQSGARRIEDCECFFSMQSTVSSRSRSLMAKHLVIGVRRFPNLQKKIKYVATMKDSTVTTSQIQGQGFPSSL
jgi:hypothetical protein